MGYKHNNPLPKMKSALSRMKAEKKMGLHRDSALYNAEQYGIQGNNELDYMPIMDHGAATPMHRESAELEDMPIVDIEKGDAEGDGLKKRIARKQEQVDASKASFGTDNVDRSFDRKLKSLKRKLKRADKRGINIENYDTRDASGVGKVKTSRRKNGVLHGETFVITKSPAKMKDKNSGKSHGEMSNKELHNHGMVYHTAKHPKYDKTPKSNSPATRQGYNARLDESLAKDGKESSMKQSLKDRRDESKGMEKSTGKGAYSSDPKMS